MSEAISCRVCYEESDKVDLISPCGCKGSAQFICKDCLNHWLKGNKGNRHYFECNECKKKYIRFSPSGKDTAVDFEMTVYAFTLAIASAIILVMSLFFCGISPLFCTVMLIILYIITILITIVSEDIISTWIFIALFYAIMRSGRKIKTFITDLWMILLYGMLAYEYIGDMWNNTRNYVISNYMSKIKSLIYDYHTKTYVDGVI